MAVCMSVWALCICSRVGCVELVKQCVCVCVCGKPGSVWAICVHTLVWDNV